MSKQPIVIALKAHLPKLGVFGLIALAFTLVAGAFVLTPPPASAQSSNILCGVQGSVPTDLDTEFIIQCKVTPWDDEDFPDYKVNATIDAGESIELASTNQQTVQSSTRDGVGVAHYLAKTLAYGKTVLKITLSNSSNTNIHSDSFVVNVTRTEVAPTPTPRPIRALKRDGDGNPVVDDNNDFVYELQPTPTRVSVPTPAPTILTPSSYHMGGSRIGIRLTATDEIGRDLSASSHKVRFSLSTNGSQSSFDGQPDNSVRIVDSSGRMRTARSDDATHPYTKLFAVDILTDASSVKFWAKLEALEGGAWVQHDHVSFMVNTDGEISDIEQQ